MTQVEYYHVNDDRELIIDVTEDNKPRSYTDRSHLFIFLMFFVLWAGIAIYAFSTGDSIFDYYFRKNFDLYMSALFVGRFIVLGFVWLAILCLGLFFIVINWIPKYTIYFNNFAILALLLAAFVLDLILFPVPIALAPFIVLAFATFSIILYVLHQVGTDLVCKIIRDSSRAIRAFPLSIVIVIIQLALIAFIIFCCTTISIYLTQPERLRYESSPLPYILLAINIIYSIWMIFFVLNVGRALLHGSFVVWYQAEDKSAIPKNVISRQLNNTLKYHLGTLAFGSTIFTKLQVLRSLCSSEICFGNIFTSLPKFLCFLILLGHSTVNALIFSVIRGKHSYESTKYSLNFLMKNHKKFVAVRVMTIIILTFGFVIISIIPIGFTALYFATSSSPYHVLIVQEATMTLVSCISIVLTAVLLYVFNSAIEAVLFSHLHELNENENIVENDLRQINQVLESPPDYYQHV